MTTAESLFEQALELDEAARTELADRLYESVTGEVTPEWEKAWLAEIGRREAEHLAGRNPDIPVDEVIEHLRAAARHR
ncbi:MAG: addiction module protein [Tepidiformaceae bacterium]